MDSRFPDAGCHSRHIVIGRLRGFRLVAILVLGVAVATELGIRLVGMLDFPIYAVDPDLGYRTRPNQSGSFLHRNTWAFNDRGMPIGENWDPRKRPNLLLIGNSIIMGGNPYPQQDKVGPLVQRELGDGIAVWPAAVGGWTQVNETAYLEHNADVVSANGFFVWEVMRVDSAAWRPGRASTCFQIPDRSAGPAMSCGAMCCRDSLRFTRANCRPWDRLMRAMWRGSRI